VWRVIRSNFWLILITLILFSVGGYLVNRFILRPYFSRYESAALLRIKTDAQTVKPRMEISSLADGWEQAIRQEAVTQAGMLKHDSLLIDVLSDPNNKIRQTTWWSEFGGNLEKAKEDLQDNFVVAPIPESSLI